MADVKAGDTLYGNASVNMEWVYKDGSALGALSQLESLKSVPLPAMYRWAKAMMEAAGGNVVILARRTPGARGTFTHHVGGAPEHVMIKIDPQYGDPDILRMVFAHEIGHMIDYMPDFPINLKEKAISIFPGAGNIIARLNKIRNTFDEFMGLHPGAPGQLTPEDKARLREEAESLLTASMIDKIIEETITTKSEVTPEMILELVRGRIETNWDDPLYRYYADMDTAAKKAAAVAAMANMVPEDWKKFAVIITKKTGKTYRVKEKVPPKPEDVEKKFDDLLREEIKKRKLFNEGIFREELNALSKWWKPYDAETETPGYVAYRQTVQELYADAMSVFINTPGELEQRAPKFYLALQNWMRTNPAFVDAYLELQGLLHGEPEEMAIKNREWLIESFGKGDAAIKAAIEKHRAEQRGTFAGYGHALYQAAVSSAAPIDRRVRGLVKQGVVFSDASNARYAMDELYNSDNSSHMFMKDVDKDIWKPLHEAGISFDNIGEYLFLRRIINERNEIINPGAFDPVSSKPQMDNLRQELGDKKFKLLEDKMFDFGEMVYFMAERAVEVGAYSRETFNEKIVPNRGNYAAFAVVHHIRTESAVSPQIHRQVGTFSDVANPFLATVMKMVALNRLIESQIAKNKIIDFMQTSFLDEISKVQRVKQGAEPRRDRLAVGHDYLHVLENGKVAYYMMPKEIVAAFHHPDLGNLSKVVRLLSSATYKIFHPLFVTYNPSFAARNLPRDLRRTHFLLAAIGSKKQKQMLAALRKGGRSYIEARKLAAESGISLGQVLAAYWKSIPVAYRRARGIDDATIDQMMREKALSIPFVTMDADLDEQPEGYQVQRLARKYGITDKKQSKWWNYTFGAVEGMNVMQETMSKVAAFNLLKSRGVPQHERAFLVNNYAGTPNWRRRGTYGAITNGIWMYSKVRWNGLASEADIATDVGRFARKAKKGKGGQEAISGTAAGYWWRRLLLSIFPAFVKYGALMGLLGASTKKMMEMIPEYYLTHYDVIPMFPFEDDDGREKTAYMTIAQDDGGRFLHNLTWTMMNFVQSAAGRHPEGRSMRKSVEHVIGNVSEQLVPNVSPVLDIASKWMLYSQGINPYDSYFNEPIIPENHWQAGGWDRDKKMISWGINKFGVVSIFTHFLHGPVFGETFGYEDESTRETTLRSLPGIQAMVRISDRGVSEKEWELISHDDREMARAKLKMPANARRLNSEKYRLNKAKSSAARNDRPWPDEREDRRKRLQWWASKYYNPIQEAVSEADVAGQDELADNLRKVLEELSTNERIDSLRGPRAKISLRRPSVRSMLRRQLSRKDKLADLLYEASREPGEASPSALDYLRDIRTIRRERELREYRERLEEAEAGVL